jgi:hypothetical protein
MAGTNTLAYSYSPSAKKEKQILKDFEQVTKMDPQAKFELGKN